MNTLLSDPRYSVEAASTSGRMVGPAHDSRRRPSGGLFSLALVLAAVLGTAGPVHSALQGPVFPPPGGFDWDEIPGVATNADGAGGKTGGMNWFFSNIPLATTNVTYWGPSNANAIAMSFYSSSYTNGEYFSFAPALSDLPQGRAVWTGQTLPAPWPTSWPSLGTNELVNVAPFGTSVQSSTVDPFVSSNAIDGSLASFTHTATADTNAWWQVDLGMPGPVMEVVLFNREGCCGSRLRDIYVEVLDAGGNWLWGSDLLNPENSGFTFPDGPPFLRVAVPGVTGRFVKVRRVADPDRSGSGGQGDENEPNTLGLGEVEVWVGPIYTRFTVAVTNLADNLPLGLTAAASVGLPPDVGALVRVTPDLAFQANLLFEAALAPNGTFYPALELYDRLSVTNHWLGSTRAYSTFTSGFYYYANPSPPTIDPVPIPDQHTARGTPIAYQFSVGDAETPVDELVVTATSDNEILVPATNIVLSGEGAGRQVLITPAEGEGGNCTITLSVDDGFDFTSAAFVLTVDDPPAISPIPDQFIEQDTSTRLLAFTIGDTETPAAGLQLFAYSNNPELVPPDAMVLGGSDAERTLKITPAPGQAGQALITLTVDDGVQGTNITFRLTVNGRPTISDLPDLLIQQDTATGPLAFRVGDRETPAADLAPVKGSSNTNLIPLGNIVFGGGGSDRTVRLTPAPGQHGRTTISIGVADGSITNFDTFVLTVNGLPSISEVPDQITQKDQPTAPIRVVIGDPETPADQLMLTATSSNTNLVPSTNITLGGSGADRTLTLTPRRGQIGVTTIALAVADDSITNRHSFELKVNSPPSPAIKQDMTLQRGGSVTITDQFLLFTDLESGPTELVYTVAAGVDGFLPHYGWLYLNGVVIQREGTFTQDDVDNGRVTYTHDGQCGAGDDFSFVVNDPDGGVSAAWSFELQIQFPNVKPVTVNGVGGLPLGNRFTNVLGALNDDCTPQTLTFRVVTPPAHGTVTLDNPNSGAFSYRPNTGYSGTDSFTFQVNDGVVDADTPGTFTLTVANQPPETADGQGTTREGSPFLGQFTGSDPDLPAQALTFIVESQPPKGNVVVTDAGAGRFTYTPNPGVFGQDSFTFRVTDGLTNSATRTFTIGIRPRLDPGDLLVTDLSSRALVLIDPTGAQFALSTTNLIQSPEGLAVEAQGTIILKDKGSGLVRVNPADGSQTLVSSATNFAIEQTQAYGLGVEADGSILVPDGTNGLIRVHPVTGVASVLSTGTPFVYPRGVTVAPDGTIYVADLSGFMGQPSRVIRVHPDTGAATLVATNHLLILPTGIVVDRQGMLVVADAGGYAGAFDSVLRINPNGGSQTAVCTNGLLSTPMGLALGSDGTIFVANLQGQSIVRIDPVTGAQSIFASGGLLGMPLGLAIVPPPSAVLRLTLVQIIPQEAIVRLEGKASQHHELLRSADLVSWSKVAEGTTGPNGVLDLQDTNRPADKAFYRAVEQ